MNIANKIFELIESCKREVLIAIPKAGEGLVKQALPKLRQLNEKGVKITILTSDKFDKEATKGLNRLATLKIKKGLFGGGIITDKQYVVILLGPEISHSSTSEIVAICTDHVGLSSFASEYFEYLLKDATEIK
jgi:sugar-specific transcriptional regulator TrmB